MASTVNLLRQESTAPREDSRDLVWVVRLVSIEDGVEGGIAEREDARGLVRGIRDDGRTGRREAVARHGPVRRVGLGGDHAIRKGVGKAREDLASARSEIDRCARSVQDAARQLLV